jgi:hypothetical protein
MHVKNTLVELVTNILRKKYPRRSKIDMKKSVDVIINGTVDDSMWLTILDTMYREEDSQ